MPSGQLDYRVSCGCFHPIFVSFMSKRAKEKVAMRKRTIAVRSRPGGVAFGLLLSMLFWGLLLQQCGDIESNPGPKGTSLRQTRLTSSEGSHLSSAESTLPSTPAPQPQGELPTDADPSTKDLMAFLHTIDSKFDRRLDSLHEDVSEIKTNYGKMTEELIQVKKETEHLKKDNDRLREENEKLSSRVDLLEQKTDDLECRSKRNNLIFHGLKRSTEETPQDCENCVHEMLKEKLKVNDVRFERVHRLNGKSDSSIISCCSFFKDKVKILKEKRKLKGSDIFIGEDFSVRMRELRKELSIHLKNAKKEGKRAVMVYDHLIIDGQKFVLGEGKTLKKKQ